MLPTQRYHVVNAFAADGANQRKKAVKLRSVCLGRRASDRSEGCMTVFCDDEHKAGDAFEPAYKARTGCVYRKPRPH